METSDAGVTQQLESPKIAKPTKIKKLVLDGFKSASKALANAQNCCLEMTLTSF